jgi:mono/diheme cytochrome c family protein
MPYTTSSFSAGKDLVGARSIAIVAVLALGSLLVAAVALGGQSATKYPAAQVAAGKKVFASAGCGKCHTLVQAKSHGSVGPNLNTIKPSYSVILNQVTNGGRFMPPFSTAQGGALSTTQLKNVAAFVYMSEH